jgi:hypothetical protein
MNVFGELARGLAYQLKVQRERAMNARTTVCLRCRRRLPRRLIILSSCRSRQLCNDAVQLVWIHGQPCARLTLALSHAGRAGNEGLHISSW